MAVSLWETLLWWQRENWRKSSITTQAPFEGNTQVIRLTLSELPYNEIETGAEKAVAALQNIVNSTLQEHCGNDADVDTDSDGECTSYRTYERLISELPPKVFYHEDCVSEYLPSTDDLFESLELIPPMMQEHIHMQAWSLFAWLPVSPWHPWPRRIFIFWPPQQPYVLCCDNPLFLVYHHVKRLFARSLSPA